MSPRPPHRPASMFVHVMFQALSEVTHRVWAQLPVDGGEGPAPSPLPAGPPWVTAGMSPHARPQVADRNRVSVSGSLHGDPRPADPLPPNEAPNKLVYYPLPQAPPRALLISYVTNASSTSTSVTGLRFPSRTSWLRGSSRSILQLTTRSWVFLMQTCSWAILWPTRLIFAAPCFSPPCFVLPVYVLDRPYSLPISCPDVPSSLLQMLISKFTSG